MELQLKYSGDAEVPLPRELEEAEELTGGHAVASFELEAAGHNPRGVPPLAAACRRCSALPGVASQARLHRICMCASIPRACASPPHVLSPYLLTFRPPAHATACRLVRLPHTHAPVPSRPRTLQPAGTTPPSTRSQPWLVLVCLASPMH